MTAVTKTQKESRENSSQKDFNVMVNEINNLKENFKQYKEDLEKSFIEPSKKVHEDLSHRLDKIKESILKLDYEIKTTYKSLGNMVLEERQKVEKQSQEKSEQNAKNIDGLKTEINNIKIKIAYASGAVVVVSAIAGKVINFIAEKLP